MNQKSIKLQRTQSLLEELIPQALSELSDDRINSLTVTSVECKRGKYDANVFYDASDFTKDEVEVLNKLLNRASGKIQTYCLSLTSWYKFPKLHFKADYQLAKVNHLEDIFKKIAKTRESNESN
jgi:ribosome-binding factor A